MNEPAVIGDFRWYRSWTVGFTPCLCIECPLRVADLDIDRRRREGGKYYSQAGTSTCQRVTSSRWLANEANILKWVIWSGPLLLNLGWLAVEQVNKTNEQVGRTGCKKKQNQGQRSSAENETESRGMRSRREREKGEGGSTVTSQARTRWDQHNFAEGNDRHYGCSSIQICHQGTNTQMMSLSGTFPVQFMGLHVFCRSIFAWCLLAWIYITITYFHTMHNTTLDWMSIDFIARAVRLPCNILLSF